MNYASNSYFGEMAEWANAMVLKTNEGEILP